MDLSFVEDILFFSRFTFFVLVDLKLKPEEPNLSRSYTMRVHISPSWWDAPGYVIVYSGWYPPTGFTCDAIRYSPELESRFIQMVVRVAQFWELFFTLHLPCFWNNWDRISQSPPQTILTSYHLDPQTFESLRTFTISSFAGKSLSQCLHTTCKLYVNIQKPNSHPSFTFSGLAFRLFSYPFPTCFSFSYSS